MTKENLELCAPVSIGQEGRILRFLIDTGAEISLIKLNSLHDHVPIDVNNIIELQGITSGKINTLGSCVGEIFCNNKFYKQTFHIVKNDFKLEHDGILGSDFLCRHQVRISFSNKMGEERVSRETEMREVKNDLLIIKKYLGIIVQQNDEVTCNNDSEVEVIKPIDLKVIDQSQCGNKSKLIPNIAEVIHESMVSNQSIISNNVHNDLKPKKVNHKNVVVEQEFNREEYFDSNKIAGTSNNYVETPIIIKDIVLTDFNQQINSELNNYSHDHIDRSLDKNISEIPNKNGKTYNLKRKKGKYKSPVREEYLKVERTKPKRTNSTDIMLNKEAISACGLTNLGNTCFMNVILQTLFNVPKCKEWLNRNYITHQNKCLDEKCILCKVAVTFQQMNASQLIRPKEVYNEIINIFSKYEKGKQEDAHEFFLHLRNSIDLSYDAFYKHGGKSSSYLANLFKGVINSSLQCGNCKQYSATKTDFYELVLSTKNAKSIAEMFRSYFKSTHVTYKCSHCSQDTQATNVTNIQKLPRVLCLLLNRTDDKGNKTADDMFIEEKIDLNDVYSGKRCSTEGYALKAVIYHKGSSCGAGHYTVVVNDNQQGYIICDDDKVCQIKFKDLENKDAYLVFYEKIQRSPKLTFRKNVLKVDTLSEIERELGIKIPARTEKLLSIELKNEIEYLCKSRQLPNGLLVGNSITKPINGRATISVLNNTEKDVYLQEIDLDLVPLQSYSILNFKEGTDNDIRFDKLLESLDLSHLNSEENNAIQQVIKEFTDIFHMDYDKLSYCDAVEHKIPLFNDTAPINVKPYRLPISQRDEIQKQLAKMLADGLIQRSKSAWNAPLLIVPKKDSTEAKKKWRIVVDFRKLNDVTIADSFPLPNITDILDQLGKSKYFTTLDLSSGYHQINMSPNCREKTAFSSGYEHYEWKRMPMGLKSASHTFQRLMNSVLSGMQGLSCFVYLDDIVIYAKDIDEHTRKLFRVFNRLRQSNLKLSPEKCKFLHKEVVYLGHLITGKGIQPDPSKFSAVRDFPTPRNPRGIKSFLGMIGYYRRFIPNFAELAKPLTKLLKKTVKFCWTDESECSFQQLKSKLITPPILQYPDFEKPFILTTDASKIAISAVLSQLVDDKDLPIAFASRSLLDAESRYSATEQELLAIVWGVEYFRPYLYGNPFKILTDHKPLVWLMEVKDPSSRLIRWKLRLANYQFEIKHTKGKTNYVADCLSRYIAESNGKQINAITRSANQNLSATQLVPNTVSLSIPTVIESTDVNLVKTLANKLHFTDQDKFILTKIIPDNMNNTIQPGEVYRRNDDYFIITKDLNNICTAFKTLKELLNRDKIDKILILKGELINLGISFIEFKEKLNEFFNDTEIHFIVFSEEIRILSDKKEIDQVLRDFHDSPVGGHQGFQRTYSRISCRFQWKGMRRQIKSFIKACEICQKNKFSRNHKMPLQITTTAKRPFERIALDVVGPLPETADGYKYLLTFQDDLTKFVGAIPIVNQEADTIAREFVKHIVLTFGIPDSILTDQGTNFLSDLFKNICKLLQIKKTRTTAFHPESNGSLERSHRTMKEYLRCFVNENVNNWVDFIDFGVFTLNTTVNQATNYTPSELLYGFKIVIPNSLMSNPVPLYNYDNYYHELRYKLQRAHQIARENQLKNKEKTKINFDKKLNPISFSAGDKVWLLNQSQKGEGRKLQPLKIGPYEVVEIMSTINSKIQKGKKKPFIVHNNRLSLCNSV